ncbi:hypothetical protein RHMOL_Rhmol10G0177900 [Rhododendron molle]|uniref:Uncharacterized protein n=1 Tax=Rhododendron molle TaxID=49168 RepID=A0ACC0M4N7_RHOML|nr:hypothetical protein RHMOL_Rhmol10G0177900 [Rhododendron molle]
MADHGGIEGGGEVVDRSEDREGPMEHHATEGDPRVTEEVGAVRPSAEPVNSDIVAEERSSGVGGNSSEASNSGAVGDESRPNQTLPRDSAKDKSVVDAETEITEDATLEIREEDIAFRPPMTAATSSRHVPITLDDVAEHALDEIFAKLLEDNPVIGEYVLKAKEDRARAIEASEAAVRAERERTGLGGLAADIEAEEREAEAA